MKTDEDRYVSRVPEKLPAIDRQDPVIYGTSADGPLGARTLELYEEQGFLFFEELFSPAETRVFLDAIDEMNQRPDAHERPEYIREPGSGELRSIFDVHHGHPVFRDLAGDKRIAMIAEQILGSQVYIHQSRANLKPGLQGKEFYWHSDFETWHAEDGMPRMRAVSCSILLTDNYPFNGPLMVMPRSHRRYIPCVGQTPENHYKQSLRKQEYGVPDGESLKVLADTGGIETPHGRAGSVIFFDCNLMHGSNSNITPYPRNNLFFVFNSVHNALTDPFGGTAPRPPFVANRKVEPVRPGKRTYC